MTSIGLSVQQMAATPSHGGVGEETNVRVAVRVRPQSNNELNEGLKICTVVMPETRQILLGPEKSFTFDLVFDTQTSQDLMFQNCVAALVDGTLNGYNATILAYGQTGSGKTYTMGTASMDTADNNVGIIPRAVNRLFEKIEELKETCRSKDITVPDFKVSAQFLELYNEEMNDLLHPSGKNSSGKSNIKIHEECGNIYVSGASSRPVNNSEDCLKCLQIGSYNRVTASTNMNATSSRSHAIFTLTVKQQRLSRTGECASGDTTSRVNDNMDNSELDFETLTAKFHFVDLAGSERLKRTGATGDRAKEGISINCELLALGNVISALGDVTKRGSYVPYRNSKLTRFLQDSLGGNSRTLMIACVGPSDRDFMETLNTLVYANRARNIKNKPSINQDKASKQVSELKKRISELEAELLQYKQGKLTADVCFMNDVSDENKLLLREQESLRDKIRNLQATIESKTEEISIIKSERDLAVLNSKIKAKSSPDDQENVCSNAIDELITQYMGEMERVKSKLTQVEIENSSYKKQLANLKSEKIIPSVQLTDQSTNQTYNQTNVDFTKIKDFENDVTKVLAVAEADLARKKEKLQSTCSDLNAVSQLARSKTRSPSSGRRRKRIKSLSSKDKSVNKSSRASSVTASCDERSWSESFSEKSNEALSITGAEVDIDDLSNADEDVKNNNRDNNDYTDAEIDDGDETIDEDDDNGFSNSDADDNENIDGTEPRLKISDIAYITEEISVKEQLIEQLEKSQYALNSMRQGYDNKIAQLMAMLQNLETEKQNQLKNKDGSRKNAADAERIEKEYKRKVSALENEMKKMKSFEKINKKHLSELKRNEEKILALKNDVEAKKAEKAKLVKQMKEESKRYREKEMVQRKEVAQLKKHQRQQDNKIRVLETENKQKNVVLQQKLREMEVIRKNKKPMSDKTSGLAPDRGNRSRTAVGLRPSSSLRGGKSGEQYRSLSFRGKRYEDSQLVVAKVSPKSSRNAPMSWEKFCSILDEYVENSYSLAFSEKEMNEHIKERNRWNSEQKGVMNKLASVKANASRDPNSKAIISRLNDELEVIKCSIEEIQERIEEKQASIVALNSARESFGELDAENMDAKTAKFLLQQMITLSVERGVQQREESVKIKELEAQISEAELNKTIQQQLLDFVILDDQVVDKNNEKNILDNMNCTFIKDAPDIVSSSITSRTEVLGKDESSTQVPWDNQPGVTTRKCTKKRVTVDEMLYPKESLEGGTKESETPLMDKFGFQVMSAEELANCESFFTSLPRDTGISRVESNSNASLAVEGSPNISSHSNRKATSLRSGLDSPDSDVFQRLLRTVPRIDLGNGTSQMEVGSINFYRGSIPGLNSFPLKCQHVAEGHKKGVVAVDATESNLFTGSIDRSVKLWDLQTGTEIMSLLGFPHTVLQVRYHLPRKMLFTSSLHVIKVWDPLCKQSEMQCIQVLKSSGSCASAQDYPTPPTTKMPQGEDQINDIAFGSCGNLLYSVARNFIRIWDLRKLPQSTESIQLLPMESHKATINVLSVKKREGPDLIFTGSRDHTIKCYEAISEPRSEGVCRSLDPPHMDGVESMCMHRDWLFTGSRDRCIKKWDISSIYSCRNISTSTNAHNHWITAMTMFPANAPSSSSKGNSNCASTVDTPYLISGCRSGEIKVWDCSNFKLLGELKAHKAQINAFAKNSTCLFSASGDWDVKIWTRSSDSEM